MKYSTTKRSVRGMRKAIGRTPGTGGGDIDQDTGASLQALAGAGASADSFRQDTAEAIRRR
jgi:hypothetical protein